MKQHTTMILAATPALAGAAAFTTDDFNTALASWLANSGAADPWDGPISEWDTSKVTDMSFLFSRSSVDGYFLRTLNPDISG